MQPAQALRASHFFLVFLGGLIALAPLSMDACKPALPDMATHFGVDIVAVNLTLTTYMLGNALGQFLGGALSDHLGRRPVGLAAGTGFYLLVYFLQVPETNAAQRRAPTLGALASGYLALSLGVRRR